MFAHEHAARLDDPERRLWLPPQAVLARLRLEPGMAVADIGAGTGYFTLPLAAVLGPLGKVVAVDLQPEMLARLLARVPPGATIELVQADAAHTTLPSASQDLVFTANVWHELDDPRLALAEFARLLRPGGRVAVLDWRVDVEQPPGPPLEHRVRETRIVAQLHELGCSAVAAGHVGTYSYLVTASRPAQ
jgi:ubiquinone/menaquinone biosynthesis C-methylase UbiE